MAMRIAIIGPGCVGRAFACRFVLAGANVLGFVGRDRVKTQECVDALPASPSGISGTTSRVLDWPDVHAAHVVVFAVGDEALPGAVAAAAAVGGRPCSLWLHTSGRHGLEVFDVAKPLGVRVGSLHPLMPFSAAQVSRPMAGAPALLVGEPRSMRLLHRLCLMLELHAIACTGQNRTLYHAACALAANGATALFGTATDLLRRAGGVSAADCDLIVAALMRAAVAASKEYRAGPALSGPVRRGDAATVSAHLQELQTSAPAVVGTYVALMQKALELARGQGLAVTDCERVAAALSLLRPSS